MKIKNASCYNSLFKLTFYKPGTKPNLDNELEGLEVLKTSNISSLELLL